MDLDDELRQLFTTDDRLDVPVRADAEEIIVAGARRVRRRRIVAATASGALAVVVAIVAGVALAGGNPDAMPPATDVPTTLPAASSDKITTLPSPTSAAAPPMAVPSHTTTTTTKPANPPKTSDQPGPPDLDFQVLGPSGLGGLTLGLTLEEAQSTGLLGPMTSDGGGGCAVYDLSGDAGVTGQVYIAATVRAIAADPVETPEGVGPGWTIEQVKARYPDLDTGAADAGSAVVPAPGNRVASYRLQFADGKVTGVRLQLTNQTCF